MTTRKFSNREWRVKLVNWIKTTRIQTAMVTALSLWVGYITVRPLDITSAIFLTLIGLLVHSWGFTLNEVEDYEYDSRVGEVEGHPIAQGKVNAEAARYFAWGAAILAIVVSTLTPYRVEATVVLAISFIPGYLYDKYSKEHWWSNIYLSAWVLLMVLTGGLYAGSINSFTGLIAAAVAIQILVQVVQGDLKDIKGPENTLVEKLGVKVEEDVIVYTKKFTWLVYGLKLLEASILVFIALVIVDESIIFPMLILMIVIGVIFMTTVSMFLVNSYDRDKIKQKSSIHEIVSIVFLAVAVSPLSVVSSILIGVAPIIWYIGVNKIIHSGTLNPDI